jgi:hypothetical protein
MGTLTHGARWPEIRDRQVSDAREAAARMNRRYEAETKRVERANAWHAVAIVAALLALVLVFVAGLVWLL